MPQYKIINKVNTKELCSLNFRKGGFSEDKFLKLRYYDFINLTQQIVMKWNHSFRQKYFLI